MEKVDRIILTLLGIEKDYMERTFFYKEDPTPTNHQIVDVMGKIGYSASFEVEELEKDVWLNTVTLVKN